MNRNQNFTQTSIKFSHVLTFLPYFNPESNNRCENHNTKYSHGDFHTVSADAPHFNTMLVSGDMQVVGEFKFVEIEKNNVNFFSVAGVLSSSFFSSRALYLFSIDFQSSILFLIFPLQLAL